MAAELTPERIDAARDAARRLLILVQRLPAELRRLQEASIPADEKNAALVAKFCDLQPAITEAQAAMPSNILDFILLAAGPGEYVIDGRLHESTAHAATRILARRKLLAMARAAIALRLSLTEPLPRGSGYVDPPDKMRRVLESGFGRDAVLAMLHGESEQVREAFWQAAIADVDAVAVPTPLWAALDREWAAAQQALAAGAQPQGGSLPAERELSKAARLLGVVADALDRGEWPTPELRGLVGELLHGPARSDGTRPAGWLADRFTRTTREARPETLTERHALRAALETLGKVAADRLTDERHPQAAATLRASADALAAGAQPQGQHGAGNGQGTAPADGAHSEKPAANKPARRKRARKPALGKPLTDRQREAVETVGKCSGNINEAARLLDLDPKTVRQHYRAGMAKLGETIAKTKRPRTQAIPTDRRGQEQV